ncbi:MAG: ABC transporter substrate-binding protein [Bdellovibrionales bacterium]|nr:ABC transporter substrate-binding protein [Bdellovibrionales bacterium]
MIKTVSKFTLVMSCLVGVTLWTGSVSAEDLSTAQVDQVSAKAIDEVSHTIDLLVETVAQHPGDDEVEIRRETLHDIIAPRFDFQEMAKRSLGAHWSKVDEVQRNEFVSVFSKLLAKTYLERIEHIRKETVAIKDEQMKNDKVAVVHTIVTHKGDKFPIDYKLVRRKSGWRVYDVVIENIGLVSNYRNEFAGIIRKEQFAGLMERLKQKTGNS